MRHSFNNYRHCSYCGQRLTVGQRDFCCDHCEALIYEYLNKHPGANIPGIGGLARPTDFAVRGCIWCGSEFLSSHPACRVCDDCKRTAKPSTRRQGILSCTWCGENHYNTPAKMGVCDTCRKEGKPKERKRATNSSYVAVGERTEAEPVWEDKT